MKTRKKEKRSLMQVVLEAADGLKEKIPEKRESYSHHIGKIPRMSFKVRYFERKLNRILKVCGGGTPRLAPYSPSFPPPPQNNREVAR